jgi:zinc protease
MRAQASAQADRAMTQALYGDHPYGHLGIGRTAALRAATVDEVRAFHHRQTTPGATTLVLAGDLAAADAFDVTDGALGDWRSDGPVAVTQPTAEPENVARTLLVSRAGAPQSELRIGQVGVARGSEDYHALLLWNAVLGGQFVSRLNLRLRQEKGYTYGVRSGFDFRRGRGPFSVQTSVQGNATAEAALDVLREIAEMCDGRPVTDDELARAKAAIGLGYPRGFETASQVARGVAQLALHDLADDHFERFTSRLLAVTLDDVTAAARRHVRPAGFTTIVVGDPDSVRAQFAAAGVDVAPAPDDES